MRPIDADVLHDSLKQQPKWIVKRDGFINEGYSYDQVHFTIDKIPTVDAVPVVRCRDCRYGREVCGNIECSVERNRPPEYHGYNWFCPNGERRKDDN